MVSIKELEIIGYSSTLPTESGWYYVVWDKNDANERLLLHKAYLHVGEWGVNWGWDEEDDPERINDEQIKSMLFKKA